MSSDPHTDPDSPFSNRHISHSDPSSPITPPPRPSSSHSPTPVGESSRPPSSGRPMTAGSVPPPRSAGGVHGRKRTSAARPDTSESAVGPLPDQQFFPEGDDFDEEEEYEEEPDEGVFAFERPVTGAVPPIGGFSGSEYTSSAPNTGFGTQTIASGTGSFIPLSSGEPSHISHDQHSNFSSPPQTGSVGAGHPNFSGSPIMDPPGPVDVGGHLQELHYDSSNPPPFSGRENPNNSSFAFMNKLHQESKRKSNRPPTGQSLLEKLQRRNLHTATTQDTHTTDVTDVTKSTMSRMRSTDTSASDTGSFDTSFMSSGASDKFQSKSSIPLIPSTAGGMTDFSATVSETTGSRGLMSRGSYGMTELTGDMTVPDGMTTWGDGMGRASNTHKDTSEGGSLNGVDDMDMLEEDSPYLEVRASVSNIDDPEMPVLTLRAWFMGMFFCIVASAINTFFFYRTPAPYISPFIIQLASYPCGKFLAWCLPIRTFYMPRWMGGWNFSMNPGPFNIKEHTLIVIMANVAVATSYGLYVTVASDLWYGKQFDTGFSILFIFVTQVLGFSFAGLCRRFVVWPASMIWPGVLVVATNLNTLHAEDEGFKGGITRFRALFLVMGAAFAYYFIPGFLFSALSYFSFACWIAPNNKVVNQLFGVSTGLGMSVISFDWSQLAWLGSPLVTPWWAEVNIGLAFVLFYWILVPILYYTNVWNFAYLPVNVIQAADRFGHSYNVFNVLTPDIELNVTAYNEYSPVYLSASYSMTFMVSFAITTAIIVHTALYHGHRIYRAIINVKSEVDDIHFKLMKVYPEVPDWWYLAVAVLCLILGIITNEVWHTSLPIWGFLLSILLPLIYSIPAALIFAMTNQLVTVNLLAELIPGYLFEGQPIAGMLFKSNAVGTLTETLTFVQNQKLGHYMKVPPRATFIAQLSATTVCAFVQIGTTKLLFATVDDVCGDKPTNLLSCASSKVFFTSSVIWGVIGPRRLFSAGALYHPQLYALLVGAVLPIPIWFWVRRHPQSILRNLNLPVMLNAGTFIPPATGINYAGFLGIGVIFQFYIRRRYFAWWSKFNYVVAAALDTGTALSALFIFLVLDLPGASVNWWGNTVYTRTLDWQGDGASYKVPPPEGFGPTSW